MFIFSNLATSLDGKIATPSRAFFPLGTREDRKQMQALRRECDAILMGASTIRAYQKPCTILKSDRQPINVVISSTLEGFSLEWPFFTDPTIKRIFFVSQLTPEARINEFKKSSQIFIIKRSTPEVPMARQIVEALSTVGVKRLLIEGGGSVMWDFVSQDLIDEYHVTLTPRLIGGVDAPTLVDGPGLEPRDVVNVKLEQCRVEGDEIFLIYRRSGRRG